MIVQVLELFGGVLHRGGHLLGSAIASAHHQQHRGVKVRRRPGIEGQLGRRCRTDVVTADHDDRVETVLQRSVLRDDFAQRSLGIVQRSVGEHADGLFVGLVDTRMCQQCLGNFVVVIADHRAEDADGIHLT